MDIKHNKTTSEIDRKTCNKCGITKHISEFHRCKSTRLGRTNACKTCRLLHHSKYRLNNKEYIRYCQHIYSTSKRGHAAAMRYKENNPVRVLAHAKLLNSIRSGKITRPSVCSVCGIECTPHAHHWSYLEEHWLDVRWVCAKCHKDIHAKNGGSK